MFIDIRIHQDVSSPGHGVLDIRHRASDHWPLIIQEFGRIHQAHHQHQAIGILGSDRKAVR